jgi:hypothetical protein
MRPTDKLQVSVEVTNTGKIAGDWPPSPDFLRRERASFQPPLHAPHLFIVKGQESKGACLRAAQRVSGSVTVLYEP